MAVFTHISDVDAKALLKDYDLGELVSLQGISAGIENTNYFLTTTTGQYVLTIFEVLTFKQLPFYIELMHHLASKGIAVAQPQTQIKGQRLATLHGKPAAIVSKLPGSWVAHPDVLHCQIAARAQARCHLAALDAPVQQANLRDCAWRQATLKHVLPFLDDSQKKLIQQAAQEDVTLHQSAQWAQLPRGPVHCDLFRDNVLFDDCSGEVKLGGFIDFYFAGVETWLFDVAVAVNDWCIDRQSGALNTSLVNAWLGAYSAIRPFTETEQALWPAVLRMAALRFWISRLYDFYLPRAAETLKPHDPTHFEKILTSRFEHPTPLLN